VRCGVCHTRLRVRAYRTTGGRRVPLYHPCPRLDDPAAHPAQHRGSRPISSIPVGDAPYPAGTSLRFLGLGPFSKIIEAGTVIVVKSTTGMRSMFKIDGYTGSIWPEHADHWLDVTPPAQEHTDDGDAGAGNHEAHPHLPRRIRVKLKQEDARCIAREFKAGRGRAWPWTTLRNEIIDAEIMDHVRRSWSADSTKAVTPTELIEFRALLEDELGKAGFMTPEYEAKLAAALAAAKCQTCGRTRAEHDEAEVAAFYIGKSIDCTTFVGEPTGDVAKARVP
jgi:hypothetical protein